MYNVWQRLKNGVEGWTSMAYPPFEISPGFYKTAPSVQQLTLYEANKLCNFLNRIQATRGDPPCFEVRLTSPGLETVTVTVSITTGKAVNDHVCKSCRNDRCSKTEKVCWLCGEEP